MAQLIVRQIESSVKEGLRLRARRHGRSMEQEVREILRAVVQSDAQPLPALGSRIASRFAARGLRRPIRELRQQVKPPDLGK